MEELVLRKGIHNQLQYIQPFSTDVAIYTISA
jgi:hypothetical protein